MPAGLIAGVVVVVLAATALVGRLARPRETWVHNRLTGAWTRQRRRWWRR